VKKLIAVVVAGFAIVNGFRILFTEDCNTVSFDAVGGRRVSAVMCFADDSGVVPGWLVGVGLILFGLIVLAVGFMSRGPGSRRRPMY
jgi:hypothetical protein